MHAPSSNWRMHKILARGGENSDSKGCQSKERRGKATFIGDGGGGHSLLPPSGNLSLINVFEKPQISLVGVLPKCDVLALADAQ